MTYYNSIAINYSDEKLRNPVEYNITRQRYDAERRVLIRPLLDDGRRPHSRCWSLWEQPGLQSRLQLRGQLFPEDCQQGAI